MRQRTLEFPLPSRAPCASCAQDLHVRLGSAPGIQGVTIDFARERVRVDVDEDALPVADLGRIVYDTLAQTEADAKAAAGHPTHRPREPDGRPAAAPSPHVHEEAKRLQASARDNRRRLGAVLVVGSFIMALEVAGGLAANSLVLLADAAHYATDLIALVLAFAAVAWGMRPATLRKTFGFQRAEVVAAFLQAIALWAVSAWLVWEAYQRLLDPPDVQGPIVLIVGGITLVVNGAMAWGLHRAGGHNLNMRAAYLHILSDVLGSAAALVAGALIYGFGFAWADPLLTIVITVLILIYAWRLTQQTIHILLEGAPHQVNPAAVADRLRGIDHVRDVHDLHVWTLTSGVDSLSAHVVLDAPVRDDRVTHAIHDLVRRDFKIHHITVQIEDPACPCDTLQHSWPHGPPGLPA